MNYNVSMGIKCDSYHGVDNNFPRIFYPLVDEEFAMKHGHRNS